MNNGLFDCGDGVAHNESPRRRCTAQGASYPCLVFRLETRSLSQKIRCVVFMFMQHLLYWLNSVPRPSCALADYCADLQDGAVFADVLQFVEVCAKSRVRTNTADRSSLIKLRACVWMCCAAAHDPVVARNKPQGFTFCCDSPRGIHIRLGKRARRSASGKRRFQLRLL